MTYQKRLRRARAALETWIGAEPPDEADLRDLITDLLHLAVARGDCPDATLRMAVNNFEAETHEEKPVPIVVWARGAVDTNE